MRMLHPDRFITFDASNGLWKVRRTDITAIHKTIREVPLVSNPDRKRRVTVYDIYLTNGMKIKEVKNLMRTDMRMFYT